MMQLIECGKDIQKLSKLLVAYGREGEGRGLSALMYNVMILIRHHKYQYTVSKF
jgi:hypothetical protein